jgi:hypothetical protein
MTITEIQNNLGSKHRFQEARPTKRRPDATTAGPSFGLRRPEASPADPIHLATSSSLISLTWCGSRTFAFSRTIG